MTLKHMRIFREVCKQESITLAAESLNMAQPAVSVAIKELEAFYGIKLFERMNRRIYITDAGTKLLGYANTIINQFEEAENSIQNADVLCSLRLGANITIGSSLLPIALETFSNLHPNIHTTTFIHNSNQIEQMLLKNELDLAIVDNVSMSPYFKSELLLEEEMIAVCSLNYYKALMSKLPPHGLIAENLTKEKLLLREKGSGARDAIDHVLHTFGLSAEPIMESTSSSSLIQAALHHLGILIISSQLVKPYIDEGSLVTLPLNNLHFLRHYYIIYHQNKFVTSAMIDFINVINKLIDTQKNLKCSLNI